VIAGEIVSGGGQADAAQVDATDAGRVEAHLASVVDRAGGVDISFNMSGIADVQGQELVDMTLEDYMRPIDLGARTQFITATTAARHMTGRGRRGHIGDYGRACATRDAARWRLGTACSAIEGMLRTLAAEVGRQASVCVGSDRPAHPKRGCRKRRSTLTVQPTGLAGTDYLEVLREDTLLTRFPNLAEVGEAAALVASDRASAVTGAAANITCGQFAD